jgi:hypothetical protein
LWWLDTLLCMYWIYEPEAYFLNREFELELELLLIDIME